MQNHVIDPAVEAEIQTQLDSITKQHQIRIIGAIESGSRSWGFPSPDSDYDVRFIYAHPPEWYIQLTPERDVIELPISAELDIVGWDVSKAMLLANKGNATAQEWMISPLIYRQDQARAEILRRQIARVFNARATFHHYRAMAKQLIPALDEPEVKLKRFFYISRATLSALWLAREHSMPTTMFPDLLMGLTDDTVVQEKFTAMIQDKATKTEGETGAVDPVCLAFVRKAYREIMAVAIEALPPRQYALGNEDLRRFIVS